MNAVQLWAKRVVCVVVVMAAMVLSGAELLRADAAAASITVTSALSGERLYSGNDLQEAFSASQRGCIVSVGRYVTLTADVVLEAEVMLSGYSYIRFGDYKIQLAGKGALFVDTRMRTKYIAALNSYSTLEMTEESGGYLYYLITQPPVFEEVDPSIDISGDVLGSKVDEDGGFIYQDVAVGGIAANTLAAQVDMPAENADDVRVSFQGTVLLNGETCVANGATMTISATNRDYQSEVTKTYIVILLGDVNGNGRVDSADASLIACHANGTKTLEGYALLAADADQNGQVTLADAELLCQKYVRSDSYSSPL